MYGGVGAIGDPTAQFSAIRDSHFREQDEDGGENSSTDFIHDVPLELAKAVCGYRADEDEETVFFALERAIGGSSDRPASGMSFLDKLLAPFRRSATTHP